MPTKKHEYEHEAEAFGGVVRYSLRKTGPRNFRAVGVLSYGGGAVQLGFQADIQAAVKVNDPTGLLTQATGLVPQIVAFLRTANQVASSGQDKAGAKGGRR